MGTAKVQTLLVDLQVESAELRNGLKQARAQLTGFGAGIDAAFKAVSASVSHSLTAVDRFSKQLKRTGNDVAQLSGVVAVMGGAALKLAAEMDGGAKAAMDGMTLATKQLAVPVAQMLLPAIQGLTKDIQTLALWVSSLDPATKEHVATVAKWAVELGGLAFVGAKAASMLGVLANVLKGTVAVLSAIGLGPILAIAVVVAGVVALHAAWRTNFLGIRDVTKSVAEWFANTWDAAFSFTKTGLSDFVDGLISSFGVVAKKLLDLYGFFRSSGMTSEQMAVVKRVTEDAQKGVDSITAGWHGNHAAFAADALKAGEDAAVALKDGFLKELDLMTKPIQDKLKEMLSTEGGTLALPPPEYDVGTVGHAGSSAFAARVAGQGSLAPGPATTHPRAVKSIITVGDQLATALRRAGEKVVGALGPLGGIISAAMEGFATAGPLGAALNVLLDFATQTSAFSQMVGTATGAINIVLTAFSPVIEAVTKPLTKIIAVVMQALVPVLQALAPIFEYWGMLLSSLSNFLVLIGMLLKGIAPLLKIIGGALQVFFSALMPVVKLLFDGVRYIFVGLMYVVRGLAWVWNEFVKAIADVIEFVLNLVTLGLAPEWAKSVADGIEALAVDLAPIDEAIAGLKNTSWDAATAAGDQAAAAADAANHTDDLSKTVERLNDSLTNIPRGFRVAAARYAAQGGGKSPRSLDNLGINVSVYIGGRKVAAEVERQWNHTLFDRTGRRPPRGG